MGSQDSLCVWMPAGNSWDRGWTWMIVTPNPDAPWCWNIYLQNWAIFGVNVGKYSSTMEHLGLVTSWPQMLGYLGNGLLRSSPVSPKTTGISHRHRLLSRHDALPCGILRWRRTSDVYSVGLQAAGWCFVNKHLTSLIMTVSVTTRNNNHNYRAHVYGSKIKTPGSVILAFLWYQTIFIQRIAGYPDVPKSFRTIEVNDLLRRSTGSVSLT